MSSLSSDRSSETLLFNLNIKKRAMRRMSLFVCLCFLLPICAWSVSDNKAKQIADINFEDGTASDNLGNVIAETLNGASVISDDIRQEKC